MSWTTFWQIFILINLVGFWFLVCDASSINRIKAMREKDGKAPF